jgi:hypothetical protein
MHAYICSSCDTPVARDIPFRCSSCEAKWCYPCSQVQPFHYSLDDENAPTRCSLCFPTKPLRVRDTDLLDYALQRLQTSKKQLTEQLLEDGPIQFRKAPNVFECTVHMKGACASAECHLVSHKIFSVDGVACYGYCCEEMPGFPKYCIGCRRWAVRPAIVALLGIRKYRKTTALAAAVPRDVLINCIIKSYLWPKE